MPATCRRTRPVGAGLSGCGSERALMAELPRAPVQRAGKARRGTVLVATVLCLTPVACTERGYDYQEGRMASFGLPRVGQEQATDFCSSGSSGSGSVSLRIKDMSYLDVRDALREVTDEDVGNFGRAFRHGDEWLLVLEEEDSVRIIGYSKERNYSTAKLTSPGLCEAGA